MNDLMKITAIVLFGLAILLLAPFIGSSMNWSPAELLGSDGIPAEIFWRIRLPRVLLGFIAGSCLGLAGLTFQSLFGNSLASPYTFGVAGGASLGAVLVINLGLSVSLPFISAVTLGGLAGALVATLIIYYISFRVSSNSLILAGVALSFFFSSIMLFAQYMSNYSENFAIMRWLMGGLETIDYQSVLVLLPFFLIGAAIIFYRSRELDAVACGEELAQSRGVDVFRVRRSLFFTVSIMTGVCVSLTGPIGFVGIMVPHFCRMLAGTPHRILVPAVLFISGAFLVACDALARVVLAPAELPVGIITALIGGPFFLWILLSRSREYEAQV